MEEKKIVIQIKKKLNSHTQGKNRAVYIFFLISFSIIYFITLGSVSLSIINK